MKTLFTQNWQFSEIPVDEKLNYRNEQKVLFTPDEFYAQAQNVSFTGVNLPHDWQISHVKELYKNSVGVYKKTFTLTKSEVQNRYAALYFEGVYTNCAVWCNGTKAGENRYGYSAFEVDISAAVQEGENTIEVVCVYQNCNTRWYSGAGIFRDVFFINSPKTRLVSDGVYFSAKIDNDSSVKCDERAVKTANTAQNGASTEKTAPREMNPVQTAAQTEEIAAQNGTQKASATPSAATNGTWNVKIYAEVSCDRDACKNLKIKNTITDTSGNVLYTSQKPCKVSPLYADASSNAAALSNASLNKAPFEASGADSSSSHAPCSENDASMDSSQSAGFASSRAPCAEKKAKSFTAFDSFTVQNPKLWDILSPNLYVLHTKLFDKDDNLLDETTQYCGFKTTAFDKDKGFFLNGRHVKIYGACHHHDLGALGAAFDKNALKRQFTKLKEMGVNSVRCSHNPPCSKWMDLCDEMGLLVCDESFDMWEMTKTPFDYANYFTEWSERDTVSWVKKDRNHPSLLLWSIGNEIYDAHIGKGEENTKRLYSIVKRIDFENNAPVTFASNFMMSENTQNCAQHLDVVGYNYLERLYNDHHKKYPEWIIFGSETCSTIQSRGIYHFPESLNLVTYSDGQCSVLGNCTTNWGAKNTQTVIALDRDCEFSAGQYIWTGWDYIGEPTPYHTKNSFFGQIDTAGFEKDTFYLFKSEWTGKTAAPFVHLLPYWDWNENQVIDVKAYTNADEVELFVNEKSVGRQKINHKNGQNPFGLWHVPYAKGKIVAVSYDQNGNEIARDEKRSFGDPHKIVLKPETLDTGDLFFIQIMLTDQNGTLCENARNCITFTVTGDAELVGMDNGDSTDYDEYVSGEHTHTRRLFANRLIAIVRAKTNEKNEKGAFTVTASSKGFDNVTLRFDGKNWGEVFSTVGACAQNELCAVKEEIPSRKIELTVNKESVGALGSSCNGVDSEQTPNQNAIVLNKENPKITVTAKLFPTNATNKEINWNAVLRECAPCDFIKVTNIVGVGSGCETATIEAVFDGDCILRCTAKNGTPYDEVISDIPFTVTGMECAKLNPYTLIEGCKFSDWNKDGEKPGLTLESGITTRGFGNMWFGFEKVDFGKNGADTIHLPLYSFSTDFPVKIYDGTPDVVNDSNLVFGGRYKNQTIYNTYLENVFVLERRLFGMHEISFLFENDISFKGFYFEESLKAFSKLCATDATNIIGDSFVKGKNAVEKIGNNVCFDFTDMDFGDKAATKLTIYGRSNTPNNTIHVKFFDENGNTDTKVIEFAKTADYREKTFEIGGVSGKQSVSFVFLPGSDFDFAWFKFE